MCFTISVHSSRKALESRFGIGGDALKDFSFHYFYRAFNQPQIPVITQRDPGQATLCHWGLIPPWAGDMGHAEEIRRACFNARAETLDRKPAFRESFKSMRCLIPVTGFFEWQQRGKQKQAWFIRMKDQKIAALAGLFSWWEDPDRGEVIKSFCIVTTAANPLMAAIHNSQKRMPLILPSTTEKEWIRENARPGELRRLMLPFDETRMHAHPVSAAIGLPNASPSDGRLIEPVELPEQGRLF